MDNFEDHLSKACKGRSRCLYCGNSTHDSAEDYVLKQSPPKCTNCDDGHLATSHDCLEVIKHKMVLSAATENISFMEVKRLVDSSSSSFNSSYTSNPRFDFTLIIFYHITCLGYNSSCSLGNPPLPITQMTSHPCQIDNITLPLRKITSLLYGRRAWFHILK